MKVRRIIFVLECDIISEDIDKKLFCLNNVVFRAKVHWCALQSVAFK